MAKTDERDEVVTGPRSLWATVLRHGLKDHLQGRDQRWIETRSFQEVCLLAGFDPQAVRARLGEVDKRKRGRRFL